VNPHNGRRSGYQEPQARRGAVRDRSRDEGTGFQELLAAVFGFSGTPTRLESGFQERFSGFQERFSGFQEPKGGLSGTPTVGLSGTELSGFQELQPAKSRQSTHKSGRT